MKNEDYGRMLAYSYTALSSVLALRDILIVSEEDKKKFNKKQKEYLEKIIEQRDFPIENLKEYLQKLNVPFR